MNYLRHMAVFAKVVECGSISAAAESLSLSKSVISQHLKVLEQELGIMLLKRTTRRQTLTPAGTAFYEKCQQMNQLAQEAWEGARESQLTPTGAITITAPHALMGSIVAPAIGELVSVYPAIIPHLVADDGRIDIIEHGIDFAVRVGESPSSSYRQRRIGQFRDVLCGSPGYISQLDETLAYSADLSERLSQCDYVANVWQGKYVIHHLYHQSKTEPITLMMHPTRFADSLPTTQALIEAGAGLGIVPEFIFHQREQAGLLKEAVPGSYLAPTSVYAMHAFNNSMPLLVRLCIDAIESRLSTPV
ncbi:LysR family transcriptional regulator [Photobacterium sp. SDRW27]|uniref:LysR family transcriptional regulator n=1 Tax=Photobacterium obscurum TaxID=2829490 RepID=UPI002243DD02|nr:LysR family transcriptional regulator [Photobacterium obscurum]MCW8327796.1 LysR family transcriptional regulator [Photobacterium obscurum]